MKNVFPQGEQQGNSSEGMCEKSSEERVGRHRGAMQGEMERLVVLWHRDLNIFHHCGRGGVFETLGKTKHWEI